MNAPIVGFLGLVVGLAAFAVVSWFSVWWGVLCYGAITLSYSAWWDEAHGRQTIRHWWNRRKGCAR